jgi:hypothetical protein
MIRVLSHSSKMGNIPSFDVSLSTCQDSCNYGNKTNLCYMKNNMQYKMNKKYKEKIKRNTRLINTKSFYKVLDSQIKESNCLKFRYFVSGDINTINQLSKIVYVAELNPNVLFWMPTHRFDLVKKYLDIGCKLPKNLNVRISNPLPNSKTPEFLIKLYKKYGLNYSESSLNKSRVNCKSSYNNKTCLENNCDKCFSNEPVTYQLHGKFTKMRLKRL